MFKELLPLSIAGDEKIKAFAEAFEKQFEKLYALTEIPCILPRINELSEPVLDLLGWQFHVEGWELARSIEEKRELVEYAIELHRYKGTKYAVKKALSIFGLFVEIIEWFDTGGNLPPYTFSIITQEMPEDFEKVLFLINNYKRESAHLVLVTDGNCRKRLNLDRTSKLSGVLLSSLDGIKKDGIRFCFVKTKEAQFEKKYEEPKEHITRYLSARHFPVSRAKLDAFKLSKVKAEIPPFQLHWFEYLKSFQHHTEQKKEFFRNTLCTLLLSQDKLSVKGFQGRIVKGREFKLSISKLDEKSYRFEPQTCKINYAQRKEVEVESFEPYSCAIRLFERKGENVPPSLSRRFILSKPVERLYGTTREISCISFSKMPRYWMGTWKGYWTDSYFVSALQGRLQSEWFSTLSGGAALSQNFSMALPVLKLNNVLGKAKLSSEKAKFYCWR